VLGANSFSRLGLCEDFELLAWIALKRRKLLDLPLRR